MISIFFLNRTGEEWQKHRTALNQHMMRPRTVAQYADILNVVIDDLMNSVKAATDSTGEVGDLQDLLFRWSLECESSVKK